MSWNYAGIVVGPPGCGKTTLARSIIAESLKAGRVVLAHDPLQQFKQCARYADAAAWRAVAAQRKPMPRGASIGGKASEVVALAVELGKRANHVDRVQMPMLLVFDEGSLLETSGSTWTGVADNELIATRRHLGIGLLYLLQRRTQLASSFFELASDVYLYRQPERRIPELEELLHLERGELAALATAPEHHYVHVQPGRGLVR